MNCMFVEKKIFVVTIFNDNLECLKSSAPPLPCFTLKSPIYELKTITETKNWGSSICLFSSDSFIIHKNIHGKTIE